MLKGFWIPCFLFLVLCSLFFIFYSLFVLMYSIFFLPFHVAVSKSFAPQTRYGAKIINVKFFSALILSISAVLFKNLTFTTTSCK
jgi:hypothetical protein